jgi:tRNA (guanosine-2'-O-)-methyltransferase
MTDKPVPRQLDGTGMKRLHREWRRRTSRRLALVLDAVGTPVNVGSISRLAAAYGVEHLWLAGATAPPTSAGARKTSLGTERYLTWTACSTGAEAVIEAQGQGYTVIGIELAEGAVPLHEMAVGDAVCLAVGHEDHGLSKGCLAACDALAYLPLVGKVGSLNVAQAAGIALYEARRQEWTAPPDSPR